MFASLVTHWRRKNGCHFGDDAFKFIFLHTGKTASLHWIRAEMALLAICLLIVFGPISLIRFHAPFAIWTAYCFLDECWMNRYTMLCSICNAFCNCKLFDVSYSNKVILNLNLKFECWILGCNFFSYTLQRRHNDHDGVPNHQPHGCLLNRLFRRRSTSKLRVTGLCVANSPGPHKGPVTRKMFPFDDVIMTVRGPERLLKHHSHNYT